MIEKLQSGIELRLKKRSLVIKKDYTKGAAELRKVTLLPHHPPLRNGHLFD
jgi:hypothetical protein